MASSAFVIKTELIASEFTEHFVEKFVNYGVSPNLEDEMELNFEIDKDLNKLNCYLTLAKPDDAYDITEIYKDCYMGTYHTYRFGSRNTFICDRFNSCCTPDIASFGR